MKMGMGFRLAQELLQECLLCGNGHQKPPAEIDVLILVGKRYEFCPICGNKPSDDTAETHRFRWRWTRRRNQLLQAGTQAGGMITFRF